MVKARVLPGKGEVLVPQNQLRLRAASSEMVSFERPLPGEGIARLAVNTPPLTAYD
jgi:hypothetical protein